MTPTLLEAILVPSQLPQLASIYSTKLATDRRISPFCGSAVSACVGLCVAAATDLGGVGGLEVRLGAVRDAVLKDLLHARHQEDVCVGVGHREDALERREGGGESERVRDRRWWEGEEDGHEERRESRAAVRDFTTAMGVV